MHNVCIVIQKKRLIGKPRLRWPFSQVEYIQASDLQQAEREIDMHPTQTHHHGHFVVLKYQV